MAAPNLGAFANQNIKTAILEVTTSMTDLIAAMASGHNGIVDAIMCTNIHASVVGTVTVVLKRSGTEHTIANAVTVRTKTVPINILPDGKPIYLEEGDSLRIKAVADSTVFAMAPWQDFS